MKQNSIIIICKLSGKQNDLFKKEYKKKKEKSRDSTVLPLDYQHLTNTTSIFFLVRISQHHVTWKNFSGSRLQLQPPIMASNLLTLSLSSPPNFRFNYAFNLNHDYHFISLLPTKRRRNRNNHRRKILRPLLSVSNTFSTEIRSPESESESFLLQAQTQTKDSPVLLDVTGMMCGGCVSRVKTILSSDDRVDSVVVNMLTETAAVKLKKLEEESTSVADGLARRLTGCGFPTKRRESGLGVSENVRKWKELVKKKEELLAKSRNRVAFAWTLVALCCGSHASHIFHSLGIHIAHGNFQLQI